jgi:hypothetical protein
MTSVIIVAVKIPTEFLRVLNESNSVINDIFSVGLHTAEEIV